MPIYEYYCKKCDKIYEIIQRITEDPKSKCDVCGGRLKKQVSLSTFHLKGSGWYVTDYAKKNGANGTNGTGGTQVKDESTTTDAKPVDEKKTSPEKTEKKPEKSESKSEKKAETTQAKT